MRDEYIICAALWVKEDRKYHNQPTNIDTGRVILGYRHANCMFDLPSLVRSKSVIELEKVQGFLTSHYRFVDRKEALEVALKVNQVKREYVGNQLSSNDLY